MKKTMFFLGVAAIAVSAIATAEQISTSCIQEKDIATMTCPQCGKKHNPRTPCAKR